MKNQQIIFQNKPPPAMKAHRQTKKTHARSLFIPKALRTRS